MRPVPADPPAPSLRSLIPSAFLPALVYEIGNGAIAPVIALTALEVGASPATAGFMLALLGVGQVIGDLPASWLVSRIGERRAMIVAAGFAVLAQLGCCLAPSLVVLGGALTVIGMGNATFYLARQAYLSDVIPIDLRARAMSTLGGSHRIGLFIGPFAGAAAIALTSIRAAYAVAMIAAAAAALLLVLVPDVVVPDVLVPDAVVPDVVVPDVVVPGAHHIATVGGGTTRAVVRTHRRLFATLGLAVVAVGAVRAARQTVVPLWAHHLGLSPERTSLIFGIASAVDMALFYPAGRAMDLRGRLAVALPSMVILGGAMMVLPVSRGMVSLAVVAVVMSLGNGIGSGIMMTLGVDTAPPADRVRFFGVWRLLSDTGNAAGPVVVAVVATAWTLAAGIVAIGSVGLLAAVALAAWVPRYSAFAWIPREKTVQPTRHPE